MDDFVSQKNTDTFRFDLLYASVSVLHLVRLSNPVSLSHVRVSVSLLARSSLAEPLLL